MFYILFPNLVSNLFSNIIIMFPKVYDYELDNGTQIVLIPIKNIKNVATSLSFDIGYLEETKEEDGLAHLAEHIISRYITQHTKIKEIKANGNYVYSNAHTNHFSTKYEIYSSNKFIEDILDSFVPLYNFNRTDRHIFYKELGAVIVELKQIISNKDKYIKYKNLPELVFGENGIMVNDPVEEIKNLKGKTECELINFVQRFYKPVNSVLTIVGDFDKAKLLSKIKLKFNKIVEGDLRPKRIIKIPKSYSPKYNFELSSTSKLNNLYLGFSCPHINNSIDLSISILLKKMLVELNDTSILFSRLRSKLGVVYSPGIKRYLNNHYGLFIINYNIETHNYEKGFTELINILNELKEGKIITEALINIAKDKIMYEINVAQHDNTPENYLYYSDYILQDRDLLNPLQFYNKYIKNISINKIKNWCKKIFIKQNSYLCVVGKKDLFKDVSIKELKRLK